jgi:MAF protein
MTTNAMTKQAETEKEGPVLILASTSRYRRELLERLCLPFDCPFECLPPTCDEEALKDAALASGRATPEELVCMLARAKAQSIAEARPEAIVIGSDQICVFEGEILGKPGTKRRNILQLQRMQGKSHELLTAVSVLRGGEAEEHLDRCRLTLRAAERGPDRNLRRARRAVGLRGRLQARARGDRAHGAGRERGPHGDCRAPAALAGWGTAAPRTRLLRQRQGESWGAGPGRAPSTLCPHRASVQLMLTLKRPTSWSRPST